MTSQSTDFITEPERKTPVVADVDVAVVGGGSAGIVAAVAAARTGATTLIVERYGHLGGYFACQPGGGAYGVSFQDMNGEQIIHGLPWEFLQRLISMEGAVGIKDVEVPKNRGRHIGKSRPIVFYEAVKTLAFEMMEEEGVRVLLHSLVVDAVMEDEAIVGFIVENKSGRQAIRAKMIVDCTGDADLAAYAGAPFEKTPKENLYQIQRGFKLAVVNERGRPEIIGRSNEPLDMRYLNAAYNFGDATDVWDLTRAEIEIRKRAVKRLKQMREQPGYETAYIFGTGESSLLGVRETRRILGEYVLSAEDIASGRKFADSIARSANAMDMHKSASDERGENAVTLPVETDYYDIPFRCLVPSEVDNLLIAGRCISATHEAQAATRKVPNCMATGQAAGTAAALAARSQVSPRQLDIEALQATLRDQGVYI